MKSKELKFIAHQLCKITSNIHYYYPENQINDDFNRNLDYFFEDAEKYINACDHDGYIDDFLTIRLPNRQAYEAALNILKYFDYIIEDDDETSYTIDEEKGIYEFFLVLYSQTPHELIFNRIRDRFSLIQLSELIQAPVLFKFEYLNNDTTIIQNDEFFKVENGTVEMSGTFLFDELTSLNEVYRFNMQLYRFIRLFPSKEIASKSKFSIERTQ